MNLNVNGQPVPASPGQTLFDCAEAAGIRIPTSCVRQGKCRECMVQIAVGADRLSPRTAAEDHLPADFRLSCQTRIVSTGEIRCHTLRRGQLRIETDAVSIGARALDPAVPTDGPGPALGLAMDLGTTTVVLRLHDLRTGQLLATRSFENPQRFGGSDVLARIRYDGEHRGRLLQRTLLGYLSRAIDDLPASRADIRELVVAANATMRDLFFGLDVQPMGVMPYESVTGGAPLSVPARRLRLSLHPDATVYGLPLLGGHVGADAAAALLATGIADGDGVGVVVDLGTNTEVLVGQRGRVLVASCPAGPAFEGGAVLCGMPALEGAIDRIRLADVPHYEVIGGVPPQGICGSGLVDLLAELRRTEQLDSRGRFTDDFEEDFPIAPGIVLYEADISELAQAKGANIAGLRIALDRFGVGLAEVETLFLAGGFGRHLDLDNARRIGLLPDIPQIRPVGNASLEGASRALLSATARRGLEILAKTVTHVSLETHPDFFEYFVEGCQMTPVRP